MQWTPHAVVAMGQWDPTEGCLAPLVRQAGAARETLKGRQSAREDEPAA
jgi:hypothetical protein